MTLVSFGHLIQRAVFVLVATALALCAFATVRRGYAEWIYSGTNDLSRVRVGCELEPADPECALLRAEITENTADELAAWERAALLAPRSAEVLTHTALLREMNGDTRGAEQLLLTAETYNHVWLPRWTLANFYLRQQRPADALKWARLALNRAYGDRRAVFRLCREAGAADGQILDEILDLNDPQNLSAFLAWITEEDRLEVLDQAAQRYLQAASRPRRVGEPAPDATPGLLSITERLLQGGHPEEAHAVWQRLLATRHLQVVAPTRDEALTNPSLVLPGLNPPCFDWRTNSHEGVDLRRGTELGGIVLEFSGRQPEAAELLVQAVDLAGHRAWALDYELATRNTSAAKLGLEWALTPWGGTGAVDASLAATSVNGDGWTHERTSWKLSGDARFFRLGLMLRRLPGQNRIEGEVQLRKLHLGPLAAEEEASR